MLHTTYHVVYCNLSSCFLPNNIKIKVCKIHNSFFLSCTLRIIFEPKGESVTDELRRLYSQKLHNLSFAKYNKDDKMDEDEMERDVNLQRTDLDNKALLLWMIKDWV